MEIKIKDLNEILPESKEIIKRRVMILKSISELSSPGRRTLARNTSLGERTIRNDLEILSQEALVEISSSGISISEKGMQLLQSLEEISKELFQFEETELRLQESLMVPEVILIPGDSGKSLASKKELGKAGAEVLSKLKNSCTSISVAGGSTLAEIADHLVPSKKLKLLVLPARGGLGEEMELQANSIAAKIAGKLEAKYKLLHIPDAVGEKIAEELLHNQQIAQVIALIRESEVLFLSVSNIEEIAKRGQIESGELDILKRKGAVAEALGYFFNKKGEVVYSKSSIGIKIEDLEKNKKVVLVAGGENKAEAIEAVSKKGFIDILITDEGAAKKIITKNN